MLVAHCVLWLCEKNSPRLAHFSGLHDIQGVLGGVVVKALRYIPEGLGIDSRFLTDSWTLSTGPIGCLETSVRYYHYSLRNNTEQRSSQLLSRGSRKWRTDLQSIVDNHRNGSWQRKLRAIYRNKICSIAFERTGTLRMSRSRRPTLPGVGQGFVVLKFESTAYLILRVTNPPLLRCKYCYTNARDFVKEI